MSQARESVKLYLNRGRTREILDIFDEADKVFVLGLTLMSSATLEYYHTFHIGVLEVKMTNSPISYITPQTLDRHQCEDLIRNYDLYADEILERTGENLLGDDRVYITSIDLLDKEHNYTVRFRVLKKEEREYTERYQKIISGDRPNFKTSLEFENKLRKQIQNRRGTGATQRIREIIKPTDQTSVFLQNKIPNVYDVVDKRIVLSSPEPYIKMKERSDRYEYVS